MFNPKTVVFCLLATMCQFSSEITEQDRNWKTVEINGIEYRVNDYDSSVFYIEQPLSILRQRSIADIDKMDTLVLHHTGIREIQPGAFENLPDLDMLVISRGDLRQIGPGIFNNLNVTELTISDCNISIIAPDTFDNMTTLKMIRLDYNKLKKWDPNWFSRTPSLRDIYVNQNLLEEIPADAFKSSQGGVRSLENVFFYKNKIKKIDENAFRDVKYIFYLQFSGNQFEQLDGNFFRGPEVVFLNFCENKIRCLMEEDFDKILVATYVNNMIQNPWDPECSEKITKWAANHDRVVSL